MDWDLRFENRLDAEQIITDQVINIIFKDYLNDEILRDEVVKRVQDILDLIYEHIRWRKKKKEEL